MRMTETEAIDYAGGLLVEAGWEYDPETRILVRENGLPPHAKIARLRLDGAVALAIIHVSETYDSLHLGPLTEIVD